MGGSALSGPAVALGSAARPRSGLADAAALHALAAPTLQLRAPRHKKKAPILAAASSLDIPQCWHEPRRTGACLQLLLALMVGLSSPTTRGTRRARFEGSDRDSCSGRAGMLTRGSATPGFPPQKARANCVRLLMSRAGRVRRQVQSSEKRPGLSSHDLFRRQARPAQKHSLGIRLPCDFNETLGARLRCSWRSPLRPGLFARCVPRPSERRRFLRAMS